MGVKERRAREKARLRTDILDAALAIAETGGWDAVTIRAVATRIEFSPAIIYEHFAAKRDILSEVALRGLRALGERLESETRGPEDDRLERLAKAIWSWAFDDEVLFQLIHTGGIFEFGTAATPGEARAIFALVRDALAGCTPSWRKEELDDLTDLLWASLSGLILLTMFDRIAGGPARAIRLRDRLIADLKSIWGQSSHVTTG